MKIINMATYKKNNNRPNRNRQVENLDEEQEQQLHTESTTAEVFDALDLGASKSEDFVRNNQKTIIGVLIGIAVIGLGYLLYQQFVKAPNEQKAANEFFFAQQFFDEAMQATNAKERDSLFKVSINGGGGKYGYKQIAENYSGTKAANLAQYGMGMAYMRLADYNNAIKHSNNDFITPLYLKKAGIVATLSGKKEDALKYYERIKDEFPASEEARTIDIFIGKISE